MAKTEYAGKLADPRWQRKRLFVLDRDGWACQWCGDERNQLDVHHLIYRRGIEPWEYRECELLTLCHECHEKQTQELPAAIQELLTCIRVTWKMSAQDIRFLVECLAGIAKTMETSDPWYLYTVLDANYFEEILAAAVKISPRGYGVPLSGEIARATNTLSQA